MAAANSGSVGRGRNFVPLAGQALPGAVREPRAEAVAPATKVDLNSAKRQRAQGA